jgi:uncharacterized HAD superfamily protein
MNFGFDIDGTITAAPVAFAAIAKALLAAGHEVHVLTGTMDTALNAGHMQRRKEQLATIGFPYTHLTIVHAPLHVESKAAYCRDHDIVLMFEDSIPYGDAIAAAGTFVMMVHA